MVDKAENHSFFCHLNVTFSSGRLCNYQMEDKLFEQNVRPTKNDSLDRFLPKNVFIDFSIIECLLKGHFTLHPQGFYKHHICFIHTLKIDQYPINRHLGYPSCQLNCGVSENSVFSFSVLSLHNSGSQLGFSLELPREIK